MSKNTILNSKIKTLAIPIVLNSLISNSFSLIDTLMISSLGDKAVSAVSIPGQFNFIIGLIMSAIYGISAFLTQFYSAGNMNKFKNAFGLMLLSAVGVSTLMSLVIFMFPNQLVSIFLKDSEVIKMSSSYIKIIVFLYIISSIQTSYMTALSSIGKVKISLYIGVFSMIINTIFNFILIFGIENIIPPLGVKGAAYASLISATTSLIITLGYIYTKKYFVNFSIKDIFGFDFKFAKQLYKTTLPLIFHESFWSVGNVLYTVMFGYLGIVSLNAFNLTKTVSSYFMIGIFGFSFAARVIIGEELAKDNIDTAKKYAITISKYSIISSLIICVIMILTNGMIVNIFNDLSQETRKLFSDFLYIQALTITAYFLNNVWIVGFFRTGGDNLYTFKLIVITTWCITIPLMYLGIYVFKLPVQVIFLFYTFEEVSKFIIGYFRFKSFKWAKNLNSIEGRN